MARGMIESDMSLTAEQEIFLNENTPLVKFMIREFSSMLDYDTLFSEGMIGLVFAIKRFDESKGNKFSTYARLWIRKRMMDAITLHNRPLRGSRETNQMVEISEVFGNDAIDSAEGYSVHIDMANLDSAELNSILKTSIEKAQLSPIEIDVIECVYGINGNQTTTLDELSDIHGYTQSAIKAICERAKRKIREEMPFDLMKEITETQLLTA